MGIIETRIKNAVDRFKANGDLEKFACTVANVGDYSVHSEGHASIMYDAIKKYCPSPVFECVFYDGENEVYHLLDFDPNKLDNKSIQAKAHSRLQHQCHIDPCDVDEFMDDVYLINVNTMIKIK